MAEPLWTDEQLNRFTVAEVCLDELLQINDEFPGFFDEHEVRALRHLGRSAYEGFVHEPLSLRFERLKSVRDRLTAVFPVKYRTHAERIMKEPPATPSPEP
jgi:hypothetical protein